MWENGQDLPPLMCYTEVPADGPRYVQYVYSREVIVMVCWQVMTGNHNVIHLKGWMQNVSICFYIQ